MKYRVICRFREFDQGGTLIIEESYDVTSGDIGWLLNFAEPPGAVERVVPYEGSNR